jgi:limonene-1,2-epoxide hydrolase
MTDQASPSKSDQDISSNARTVQTFLTALQDEDYDTAESLAVENLVWQNVGWPTVRGRDRVMRLMRSMAGRLGFEVKFHRIAADGDAVLTERTDALTAGPLRFQFWVCGSFEVQDGQITLWRDHFDIFDCLKATVRAIAATVFPSLRPSF